MNTLSWLIYLSGLVDKVTIVAILTAIGCGIILVFCGIDILFDGCKAPPNWWRKIAVTGIIAATIAVIMPSQKTILAIAASEFSQELVTSDVAKELAIDAKAALKSWLKEQTKEGKK